MCWCKCQYHFRSIYVEIKKPNQYKKRHVYIYIYVHTYTENPTDIYFWRSTPLQNKAEIPTETRGPIWVLGICLYIYFCMHIIFVANLFFMQTQSPGRWSSSRLLSPPAAPENSQKKALRTTGNQAMWRNKYIYIYTFIPITSMYGQVRRQLF